MLNAQPRPPMGRRRTKDFDLPPRMVRRRGARGERFYYITHEGKWIPLGKDLNAARRLWAEYESIGPGATVGSLIEKYLGDCMAKRTDGTRAQYRSAGRRIVEEWGTWSLDELKPFHVAQFRDRDDVAPGAANTAINLLRVAYAKAVEWGWSATNPAAQVSKVETEVRGRYLTDDELRAIRAASPDWLRTAIDLSYVTAMRPGDIMRLQWSAVTDADVRVRTQKTKAQIAFELSDDLRLVLEQAKRRPVLGLYVVATDKGRPITRDRLGDAWRAAREAARVPDAQFRDIRAKAATDAESIGLDYQSLLGHSTRAMSDRYVKHTRTIHARPLRALK
jgi:integrase